mgnify:CR=1 FL=1
MKLLAPNLYKVILTNKSHADLIEKPLYYKRKWPQPHDRHILESSGVPE